MGCLQLHTDYLKTKSLISDYAPKMDVVRDFGYAPKFEVITEKGAFNKNIKNYPFGMAMDNRTGSEGDYRYGFNGMEKDDEVKGQGNHMTTPFRQYDPRIGRWMTVDPIVHIDQSPYMAFNNNPIFFKDPSGLKGGNGNGVDPDGDEKVYQSSKSTGETIVDADGNTVRMNLPTANIPASEQDKTDASQRTADRTAAAKERLEVSDNYAYKNRETWEQFFRRTMGSVPDIITEGEGQEQGGFRTVSEKEGMSPTKNHSNDPGEVGTTSIDGWVLPGSGFKINKPTPLNIIKDLNKVMKQGDKGNKIRKETYNVYRSWFGSSDTEPILKTETSETVETYVKEVFIYTSTADIYNQQPGDTITTTNQAGDTIKQNFRNSWGALESTDWGK